jgi:hypothetical protein
MGCLTVGGDRLKVWFIRVIHARNWFFFNNGFYIHNKYDKNIGDYDSIYLYNNHVQISLNDMFYYTEM